jgi:hypothetical protein
MSRGKISMGRTAYSTLVRHPIGQVKTLRGMPKFPRVPICRICGALCSPAEPLDGLIDRGVTVSAPF